MKKILLIGDSVRKGYDTYVRACMENIAKVYFPEENCTFTTNILRNLHTWADNLGLYEAGAVHFNAGLWDTVRIYGDEPLVKKDTYADNLKRIEKRCLSIISGKYERPNVLIMILRFVKPLDLTAQKLNVLQTNAESLHFQKNHL